MIDVFAYRKPRLAHLRRYARKPLRHIDKQILHRRHIGLFTADTRNGAAFAARSFLTLETKHLTVHRYLLFFRIISYIHISAAVALPLQFKRLRLQFEYTKMGRGMMW